VLRQDTTLAAEPRAKLSRRGLRWALEAIVVQHLTVARIAGGLSVAWNTASDAVLAEGKRALIDDTTRLLSQRPKDWRDGIEVVAMDGFTTSR
jgi:2'-5' RNA ligase